MFSHYFTKCPPWMPYRAQRVPSQFLQQLLYDNMWNPSLIFYCQCVNAKNGKNGLIQQKITVEAHLMPKQNLIQSFSLKGLPLTSKIFWHYSKVCKSLLAREGLKETGFYSKGTSLKVVVFGGGFYVCISWNIQTEHFTLLNSPFSSTFLLSFLCSL